VTTSPGLRVGLKALEKYDEPTMILFPDAVLLADAEFYTLQQLALAQCTKLQDRAERILMELIGVEREEARALLAGSGGHVKTALVMGKLGVSAAEARERLGQHQRHFLKLPIDENP